MKGGEVNLNRPRRTIAGRVYVKFKPIYEWRREDDNDRLLIYLPGFRKEFIKVTTEDSNILRVRGECLVAGNKWNRFHEDFKVPKTFKMRGIHAKLDGGILTITIPRKIINPPTTPTHQPQEPMNTAIQDTNLTKPSSSSTLATFIPPSQPPLNNLTKPNHERKNDHKTPLNEKIIKTKMGMKHKRAVKMGVAVVVAIGILCFLQRWNIK